jgi:hypothetical protein
MKKVYRGENKTTDMKKLKQTFKKNGYIHKLLWRDDEYGITEILDDETEKRVCFEAFRIKIHKERKTDLIKVEQFESTPANERWGVDGYSTWTYEQAEEKINLMKNRKK